MTEPSMVGRTVSHYRILRQLGAGGMGVVYEAQDLTLERPVALKFLGPRAGGGRERQQLIDEARAAAALDHPNIGSIYEIGESEGRVFIAMALLSGRTVNEMVSAAGRLSPEDALQIGIQIAQALEAAHDRGVVHRDVKSGNVIVDDRGRARLMDFGVAARTGPSGVADVDPGKGTPAFMSPEQLLRKPVEARTDIWSWGVVMYHMLTGCLPFSDTSPAALVRGILHEDPRSPLAIVPDLPPGLVRAALRALAKRPEDRYADAADLLRELRMQEREIGHAAVRPPRAVAVLAFRDMSPERDQGHLCEGIAEEIIHELQSVSGLAVASRRSSFALAERGVDVREIGRQLRVSSVLEGSVRKSGQRLRVTAELTDVADGCNLWSAQYDRELSDVFDMQQEIAERIVEALRIELGDGDRATRRHRAPGDVEAYDYYLRGRQFFYRSTRRGIAFAIEMFRRATELDPDYALAWAGAADCHTYLFMYFGANPTDIEAARRASARALELDPDLAEARAAHGLALSMIGRQEEADAELEAATRLAPGLFEAWYFRARMYYARGLLEPAARMFEQASRCNPDDYQSAALLGHCLLGLGLRQRAEIVYQRAQERIERHLRLNPDDTRAIYLGGDCLIKTGRPEQGIEWVARAMAMAPDDPYTLYGGACAYALVGRRAEALDALERAVNAGFAHRAWMVHDGDLAGLRDDPRYVALVKRLET